MNVSYKIASACVTDRLKVILPKLIHEDQKGFMKGRYIGNNIRLLYDILLYTEKEQVPGLLFMIDLEKAFDNVSWSSIQKALDRFNFTQILRDGSRSLSATSCFSQWIII